MTKEITDLLAERQSLVGRLATLESLHEETLRELQEKTAMLAQIQGSHGWRLLSVYYRLRNKLLPRNLAKKVREGVAFLRASRLISASGLLDKEWYLRRNPDVARAAVPPLRHYICRGAYEGRDPNPFFDSDWYLQQNPDVAALGANPLVHYLRHGANEGRNPSPFFDTSWYLKQNPDVLNAGMNPLAHYVSHGAREGRSPRRDFTPTDGLPSVSRKSVPYRTSPAADPARPTKSDDMRAIAPPPEHRPKLKARPIVASARPNPPAADMEKRRLICLTHVLPYPPRAGNEYRIHRMLKWFEASGSEVFLVLCPLPNYSVSTQRLVEACTAYSNLLFCQRDGTILYHLAEGPSLLKDLVGVKPRDFGVLLGEDTDHTPAPERLIPIVRTFCPDTLVEVFLHLDTKLRPDILLVDYVFMTRPLPLARPESLKIVDTIDVFSTKHDKVIHYGIEDSLALTQDEEASLLARADLVLAIQEDEAEELRRIVPQKPVITSGIDFCPAEGNGKPAAKPIVLMVGSDNALNVKGLKDFLRFAWPTVRREVPRAELRVIGGVGPLVEVEDSSVSVLGAVDDLTAAYAEARAVINPAVAGTGLKIKTIESLCHLRPLVTWPSGVDGVEGDVRSLCYIATNWYMFARHVIHLCKSEEASQVLVRRREEILHRFSPDTTYAALKAALNGAHVGAN